MYIEKGRMEADKYIQKTREYLNYIEEHIDNIRKAFQEVSEACRGMWWTIDDYEWYLVKNQIILHDISKFSKQEFVPYREKFFPVEGEKQQNDFSEAWEHHKEFNTHHHESVKTDIDVINMIIDWTAMGYKFNDTAQDYYEKNKDKIKLSEDHKKLMYEIFKRLSKYNKTKIWLTFIKQI